MIGARRFCPDVKVIGGHVTALSSQKLCGCEVSLGLLQLCLARSKGNFIDQAENKQIRVQNDAKIRADQEQNDQA